MEALSFQFHFELKRFRLKPGDIETVFIGGGTPSVIDSSGYRVLFEQIKPFLACDAEITAEANPESATEEWLAGMRMLGVNRISFGVQSFQKDKLRMLGRRHSPMHAVKAVKKAADIGFENISIDLIYNCRGDSTDRMEKDIEQAFRLPVTHISAYELTIEKNTPFADSPEIRQQNEMLARFVTKMIEDKGFRQYEISNFGQPCRHNLGYWKLENYIGLGAGAVGFLDNRRFYPSKSPEIYIKNPCRHKIEKLTENDLLTENVFLGLRSEIGISAGIMTRKMLERALFLCDEGKLETDGKVFFNPDFFLADELALYLLD